MKLSKVEEGRALALHENSIIVDLHSDIIANIAERRNRGEKAILGNVYAPLMKKGGVDARCMMVGGDNVTDRVIFALGVRPTAGGVYDLEVDSTSRTLRAIDCFYSDLEESSDQLSLATSAEDIEKAKKQGKIAAILALEGR